MARASFPLSPLRERIPPLFKLGERVDSADWNEGLSLLFSLYFFIFFSFSLQIVEKGEGVFPLASRAIERQLFFFFPGNSRKYAIGNPLGAGSSLFSFFLRQEDRGFLLPLSPPSSGKSESGF